MTDIAQKIKQEMHDARFKKNSQSLEVFKPKDFKGFIRVLPLKDDEDRFYVYEVKHWMDDNTPLYCPTTHDRACPICERFDKAASSGSAVSVKYQEIWHEKTQRCWNMRVVVRDPKGNDGPPQRFYCSQKTIIESLLKHFEIGYKFWDLSEGYDIHLEDKTKSGSKGYQVTMKPNKTPLFATDGPTMKAMELALEDREYDSDIPKLQQLADRWLGEAKRASGGGL